MKGEVERNLLTTARKADADFIVTEPKCAKNVLEIVFSCILAN